MRVEQQQAQAQMQGQPQSQAQSWQGQPGAPGQMGGPQQHGIAGVPSVGRQQSYQHSQETQQTAYIQQPQQPAQPQPQQLPSSGQNQDSVIRSPPVVQHFQHPLQTQQHLQQNQGAGCPSLRQPSNPQQHQGGPAGVQAGAQQQRPPSQPQLPVLAQLAPSLAGIPHIQELHHLKMLKTAPIGCLLRI